MEHLKPLLSKYGVGTWGIEEVVGGSHHMPTLLPTEAQILNLSCSLTPFCLFHSRREQLTAVAFKLEPRVIGQIQIAGHTARVQVCGGTAFLTDCISEKVMQMLLVRNHNLRTIVFIRDRGTRLIGICLRVELLAHTVTLYLSF